MRHRLYLSLLLLVPAAAACGGGSRESAPAAETATPAAPAVDQAPVDPATAATVTGKVAFTGAKPANRPIRMDAEKFCAEQHGGRPVASEEVVINDNGTLANAFVYVKDGLGDRTFPVPASPVVLDQKGCIYMPHVAGAMAGQTVEILNSDATTHNVHPQPKNNPEWNVSQPPRAEKLVKTFAREELMIPIKCNVHPWMKSYLGVLKHPFFAVTGADGSFTIPGLPPGEYTIAVWHEKYGSLEQKVTVAAKETKTVDFSVAG